ncbi:MAG: hypothetical protein KDD73_01315 [Anaerolineales bacterium]|nr:hypothetical protein [Anaerolineales bacterium]MCB9126645.1 hypothetical protein [Ardenticatenales bacterium]MCB9172729.1 hypothetical protein [Ardenticatenales bacterium]
MNKKFVSPTQMPQPTWSDDEPTLTIPLRSPAYEPVDDRTLQQLRRAAALHHWAPALKAPFSIIDAHSPPMN